MTLSIVVPVYKCAGSLPELYRRITATLTSIQVNFELILVNDGSPDNAVEVIQQLVQADAHVRGIQLSRNFGQHYAITAGLASAQGEWVVVMDGDLQDQPEEIAKLFQTAQQGYEIVLAKRSRRQDSFSKRFTSKLFYGVLSYLTDTKLDPSIGNFGIYHQRVIKAVLSLEERSRFFPLLVRWVGFRSTAIDVAHAGRVEGKSSYSLSKLVRLGFEVIVQFSNKPLRITIQLGGIISFISIVFAGIILVRVWLGVQLVEGWPSMIVSIWFLSGLLMMMLGVVGLYVGKAFDQTKKRPLYIIDQTYERS